MKKTLLFAVLSILLCACNSTILKPGVTYYADIEDTDWLGGNTKETYRIELTIYDDGSISGKFSPLVNGEMLPEDRVGCVKLEGEWTEVSKNDKKFIEIDASARGQYLPPMYVDKDQNIHMNGVNSDAQKLKKK